MKERNKMTNANERVETHAGRDAKSETTEHNCCRRVKIAYASKIYADDCYSVSVTANIPEEKAKQAVAVLGLYKARGAQRAFYATPATNARYARSNSYFLIYSENYRILSIAKDKKFDLDRAMDIKAIKGEIKIDNRAYEAQMTDVKWDVLIHNSWKPQRGGGDKIAVRKKLNEVAVGLDDQTTVFQKGAQNDAGVIDIIKDNLIALSVLSKKQRDNEEQIEIAVKLFQDNYKIGDPFRKLHNYKPDGQTSTAFENGQIKRYTLFAMDEALVNGWKCNKLLDDSWSANETLNKIAMGTAKAPEKNCYKHGDKDDNVKAIQQALLNLNLLPERRSKGVTQNFLDVTQNNVELFQRYYKPSEVKNQIHKYKRDDLLIDGIVDQNTILAMDEALVNGWEYREITDEERLLAAVAYGEASAGNVKEEMFAIASVMVRQTKARNYATIEEFVTKPKNTLDKNFAYAATDGNKRFAKLKNSNTARIMNDRGMKLAIEAARNAFAGGIDYSNGAYFWDGEDISTHYSSHSKVIAGIKFNSTDHNIYNIKESKIVGKSYDYTYESVAAYGGTIFWRQTQERVKAEKGKEYL
jgi:peptidoglycan hydrolase-like protein with peptidoglycan-binding domain